MNEAQLRLTFYRTMKLRQNVANTPENRGVVKAITRRTEEEDLQGDRREAEVQDKNGL